MEKLQWWGYLHVNGTIQVKRYFSQEDLIEAIQSDFVQNTTSVFYADGRDEAIKIATLRLLNK